MYCVECGKDIGISRYCDKCGIDQENLEGVSSQIESTGQAVSEDPTIDQGQLSNDASNIDKPVLQTWKTSIGFSVAGVLLSIVLNVVPMSWLGVTILYGSATLLYALIVYPSYFSNKPRATSSKTISFLNCLFGGIVFGLLWNHNLTRKTRGISYIIASAICVVGFFLVLAFSVVVPEVEKNNRIQEVESSIEAIGDVSLGSRSAIDTAVEEYYALDENLQNRVSNLSILSDAVNTFESLEEKEKDNKRAKREEFLQSECRESVDELGWAHAEYVDEGGTVTFKLYSSYMDTYLSDRDKAVNYVTYLSHQLGSSVTMIYYHSDGRMFDSVRSEKKTGGGIMFPPEYPAP